MTRFDLRKAKRGPILLPPANSTDFRLWIDNDVLDWFRKRARDAGPGADDRFLMNHALRLYAEEHVGGLDDTMRAILHTPRKVNPVVLAERDARRRRAAAKKNPRARKRAKRRAT